MTNDDEIELRPKQTARWEPIGRLSSKVLAGLVLTTGLFLEGGDVTAQGNTAFSKLDFQSSNQLLTEGFRWAKRQALQYVRSRGPIGPWYEAALPGRNAFCMRDVSHQTEGATVLGLSRANLNMLERFAVSAEATRNWAAFWEIDGTGKPSTFDYVSDDDFWFNLPANFDVLDAAERMWKWTGDRKYLDDAHFRTFYRETLTDYITDWDLQPESILSRPRIANTKPANVQFRGSRGIPSYTEGPEDFIVGTDLMAAEYRAIRSYMEIASRPEDIALAERLQKTAQDIQKILDSNAWSERNHHFYGYLRGDGTGAGSGDTFALYFNAIGNPAQLHGALDYVSNPAYWKAINIEEESYVPAVLFRFGREQMAYRVLFDLTSPSKQRHDYPEVSYAVIAAIVSGVMGISPGSAHDAFDVETLAQPQIAINTLMLKNLRIRGNVVDVSHDGEWSTRFLNREGPPIRWKAAFKGNHATLTLNGKVLEATRGFMPDGTRLSWIEVKVLPGESVVVSE